MTPLSFDDLPNVTGWFEAVQDEGADSLMRAIGRLVLGANLPETVLRLLVAQLREERDGQYPAEDEFARLEEASAGRLLGLLRGLDIPAGLEGRIGEAIGRRNEVVHHMYEMPEMVAAVASGEGMEAVVAQIEQVALDCGTIAVELFTVAGPALEAKMGKTPAELVELLSGIDLGGGRGCSLPPAARKHSRDERRGPHVPVAGRQGRGGLAPASQQCRGGVKAAVSWR